MRIFPRVWSPRAAAATLAIVLAVGGATAIAVGYSQRRTPPPRPSAAVAGRIAPTVDRTSTPRSHPARHPSTTSTPAGLSASPPVAIRIPSIGVQSWIVGLGLNADGTVQVPGSFHVVGWYEHGAAPGQAGPAVFLGHVDSVSGPGIFYRLGAMHPGDHVVVTRRDGRSIPYVITGVRQYSKTAFPTIDVYGDTATPTIRLVTCGGTFDSSTHHYLSNTVAFGQQI
jgi:Sortase domain